MTRLLSPRPFVVALRAVAAVAAIAAFAGCGSADDPASDAPVVEIVLGRYTIEPNTVSITAGAANLHVTNTDSMPHNLTVAGYGTRNLAPGEQQTLPVDIDPGSWNMWCDIEGHADLGQTGTLTAQG